LVATTPMNRLIQHLRRSVLQDGAGRTDGQLLDSFVRHKDDAALTALVRRHGPMVWGVCCRLLRSHQDAEDAFQATFLVLVQKAATLSDTEMVGNWLYGVAHQTAVRMRAIVAKRGVRERQVTVMPEPTSAEQYVWNDLQPVLDEELSRLPDKYRVLIVLCDLEEKTRKEVAVQLAIPEGTVASRLATARTLLAKRLARRGVVVSGVLLGTVLSSHAASACVPMAVVSSTIKAASLLAAGQGVAAVVSPTVAALQSGVIKMMFVSRIKFVLAVVLVAGLVLGGAGIGSFNGSTVTAQQEKKLEIKPVTPAKNGREENGRPNSQKTDKKMGRLELGSRTDLIAVDLEKRLISATELLGSGDRLQLWDKGSRICGDVWKLSVGDNTKITIDGKTAKLDELKKVVQSAGPGHFFYVFGEWEFDLLKPRHSNQQGRAVLIEVWGDQVEGIIEGIDLKKERLTISESSRGGLAYHTTGDRLTQQFATDARVVINGKVAAFSDLKPKMKVTLQMSAVKNAPDVAITAIGQPVEGFIKSIDAEKNLMSVTIPSIQMTATEVSVSKEARVVIDGKVCKLADLKAGMSVTLQMCAESERSLIVGVAAKKATKER
jgi:RNA polymerase sigma factor (sigma-70 family)